MKQFKKFIELAKNNGFDQWTIKKESYDNLIYVRLWHGSWDSCAEGDEDIEKAITNAINMMNEYLEWIKK